MNTFIIGDIHGCFHTLEKMLTHWEPQDQKLVFVGEPNSLPAFITKIEPSKKEIKLEILCGNNMTQQIEKINKTK